MITTFYPPYSFGGDATYIRHLARGLVARGHEVTVVACRDAFGLQGQEPVETAEPGDDGVIVHHLKSPLGPLSPLITQQTGHPGLKVPQLKRILSTPFDVLNFHNVSLIGGLGVLSFGQAPVRLYTLHEHWLLCATHVFWKDGDRACDGPTCISCSIRSGIPPQLWRYTGQRSRALARIDRILSPSEYTARRHREDGIAQPISVLPLFSSLELPADVRQVAPQRASFIFCGRVTASKGLGPLLRVAATMPDIDLTIVGDGESLDGFRVTYAQYPNIEFLGRVAQSELTQHYSRATALILPSIAPETFGLAIVEAAACHIPAIVNLKSGGSAEIVSQTGGGLLYDDDNQLRDAMRLLAHDRNFRDALAAKAFAGFRKFYKMDIHIDRYLGHVDEVARLKTARQDKT